MKLPNLSTFLPSQKGDRSLRRSVLGLCLWGQLGPPVMENRNFHYKCIFVNCIILHSTPKYDVAWRPGPFLFITVLVKLFNIRLLSANQKQQVSSVIPLGAEIFRAELKSSFCLHIRATDSIPLKMIHSKQSYFVSRPMGSLNNNNSCRQAKY